MSVWRLACAAVCAAAGLLSVSAQDEPDYAAEVMQADRDFSAMAKRTSLAEAFATYMDDADGRLLRGRGEPIRGREAIFAEFADYPPGLILHWEPSEGFASRAGDFGMTWGWYYVHPDGDLETPPSGRGKYVTVWRRNADGEWRGLLDMGTSDGSYEPPTADGNVGNGDE